MRHLTGLFLTGWLLTVAPLGAQDPPAPEPGEKPTLVLDTGGHLGFARAAFFTPDGQRVITAGSDKTVRVWDVATGSLLKTLRLALNAEDRVGLGGGIAAAALAPDGNLLAVACAGLKADQHVVLLLDLAQAKVARQIGNAQIVNALAFAPDGKALAGGVRNGTIHLYDPATGKPQSRREFKVPGHNITCLAFAPDGRTLATGSGDGNVHLWNLATAKDEKVLSGHDGPVHALAWAPDGQTLASRARDRWLCHWRRDGQLIAKLTQEGLGHGMAFFPDGKRLLAQRDVWDLAAGAVRQRATGEAGGASAAALAPDGQLAVWCGGKGMLLWDVATGRTVQTLGPMPLQPAGIGWSPDGHSVGWRLKGESDPNEGDPDRAFDFTTLTAVSAGGQTFLKAQLRLGDLTLERRQVAPHWVVKRGETVVPLQHALVGCGTLVDDQRVLLGTEGGPVLYDTAGKRLRNYKGAGQILTIAPAPDRRHFVTAGKDQVVRIWSLDREEALLALFWAGREWIAWTPEGYYAASSGGERLMGWQVNRGVDQLATFYPAARFRASLFRPDVVRRVLETDSVAKALAAANAAGGKPGELVTVEQVLPPAVTITAPAAGPLNAAALVVRAKAESRGSHPVTAMQLLVDDRPYEGQRGVRAVTARDVAQEKEWAVTLSPGPHRFAVLATSAVSTGRSETVEVTCTPAATVKDTKDPRPVLHMLAIGINEYQNGIPKLSCAVADARELAGCFQTHSKTLFREVRPHLLLDKAATRAGVLQALAAVKQGMKEQDVLVISYAGHGYGDRDFQFFLLTQDADLDKLKETTVSNADLKRELADMPCGRVLLVLDACHSGNAGGVRPDTAAALANLERTLTDDDCGVVVMTAAKGTEQSLEADGHGFFTKALIEGLSGKADYNKDGLIHLTELDLHAFDQVRAWTKDRQHPSLGKPPTITSFPLAKP